jgi:Glyoxalase-like domain
LRRPPGAAGPLLGRGPGLRTGAAAGRLRDLGRLAARLPESWFGRGTDCIIDPDGAGPRIWIQVVPDRKTTSNRLHIDIRASGQRDLPIETRKKRVDAEALRLCDLGATLLSDLSEELEEDVDHYAVALKDPEGNEFDIN